MQEQTIFESGQIKVTNRRFIVGPRTYQLSNIASFTTIKIPPANAWTVGVFALLFAAGFLAFGFTEGIDVMFSEQGRPRLIAGLVSLSIAAIAFLLFKTRYGLRLDTSSGAVNAITTKDRQWVHRVNEALSQAMISE